jgi:hypothetical protein
VDLVGGDGIATVMALAVRDVLDEVLGDGGIARGLGDLADDDP